MPDSGCGRSIACWLILVPFFLGRPAHGSAAAVGEPPRVAPDPRVTGKLLNPEEDQDWSPMLFRKEHQPMPALREVFEGIKRGGHESFEKAIRTAYHLVEAYGQNEGHQITLELSDFKTLKTPEALDFKLRDIASVGFPEQISINSITREHARETGSTTSKTIRLGYGLKWQTAPPDPKHDFWANCSFRQFIEIAKADSPYLSLLDSVTTYRVSVMLDGIHRDYRAAFLWVREASGGVTFQSVDPVLLNVGLALAEQVPPEGRHEGALLDNNIELTTSAKYTYTPICNV